MSQSKGKCLNCRWIFIYNNHLTEYEVQNMQYTNTNLISKTSWIVFKYNTCNTERWLPRTIITWQSYSPWHPVIYLICLVNISIACFFLQVNVLKFRNNVLTELGVYSSTDVYIRFIYFWHLHFSINVIINMRQAQSVWRTRSYNFKREAWEGNVIFFFKYFFKFFLKYLAGVISLWLMAVPFILRREFRRKSFFY